MVKNLGLLKKAAQYFDGLEAVTTANGQPYVLFSLTDYQPPISPDIISNFAKLILDTVSFQKTNILVGSADRGSGPLVYAVASLTKLPFSLANWYPRDTLAQITVSDSSTTSGPGFICINGIKPKNHVSIITDVISTGGTVIALAQAIHKAGAIVENIIAVAENIDLGGSDKINKLLKIKPKILIKYRVINNITRVLNI